MTNGNSLISMASPTSTSYVICTRGGRTRSSLCCMLSRAISYPQVSERWRRAFTRPHKRNRSTRKKRRANPSRDTGTRRIIHPKVLQFISYELANSSPNSAGGNASFTCPLEWAAVHSVDNPNPAKASPHSAEFPSTSAAGVPAQSPRPFPRIDDPRLLRRCEMIPPRHHTVALRNDLRQPTVTPHPGVEWLRRL